MKYQGFSLVELALVLVVVAVLLGSLLVPLGTQIEQQKIRETQKVLEETRESLLGYALSKGYLPCPDTNDDGIEETRTAGACPSQEGRVPWATLGVGSTDAWGRRIRYRVTKAFSDATPLPVFSLNSVGDLRVCQQQACTTTLATAVPVVLVSHGKNGYGGRLEGGGVVAVPATLSNPGDEMENINGRNAPAPGNATPDTADAANTDFVSRVITEAGATAGEFDDLVAWISPNVLFNRMVSAGRLP